MPNPSDSPLSYESAGVRYDVMDPFKLACQKTAAATSSALAAFGFREVPNTRGESCYLFETEHEFLAHVEEALGTKTLVADAMYQLTKKSFYQNVALDDVSTIVNDLLVSGALPVSIAMYAAIGDSAYLADPVRAADLAQGFAEGCRLAGAAWSGGETQTLKGIIDPHTIILGGSAIGRIFPKHHRIAANIADRDDILFLASSGVHTNGLTLCRALAERLPQGYLTPLPDGTTYGEALLVPSVIYARFIAACQRENIPLHYAVHLTGHGWRKSRAPPNPSSTASTKSPRPSPSSTSSRAPPTWARAKPTARSTWASASPSTSTPPTPNVPWASPPPLASAPGTPAKSSRRATAKPSKSPR